MKNLTQSRTRWLWLISFFAILLTLAQPANASTVEVFGGFGIADIGGNDWNTKMRMADKGDIHVFEFTAKRSGDVYFRFFVDNTEMGPGWNGGNDTQVPTTGDGDNASEVNDYSNWGTKKAWFIECEEGHRYEIKYTQNYKGGNRISSYDFGVPTVNVPDQLYIRNNNNWDNPILMTKDGNIFSCNYSPIWG